MGTESPKYDIPSIGDKNDELMPFIDELNPNNIPDENLDDGWNDADQANEPIFCPNPELGVMELCDEQENPGPTEKDLDEAY